MSSNPDLSQRQPKRHFSWRVTWKGYFLTLWTDGQHDTTWYQLILVHTSWHRDDNSFAQNVQIYTHIIRQYKSNMQKICSKICRIAAEICSSSFIFFNKVYIQKMQNFSSRSVYIAYFAFIWTPHFANDTELLCTRPEQVVGSGIGTDTLCKFDGPF